MQGQGRRWARAQPAVFGTQPLAFCLALSHGSPLVLLAVASAPLTCRRRFCTPFPAACAQRCQGLAGQQHGALRQEHQRHSQQPGEQGAVAGRVRPLRQLHQRCSLQGSHRPFISSLLNDARYWGRQGGPETNTRALKRARARESERGKARESEGAWRGRQGRSSTPAAQTERAAAVQRRCVQREPPTHAERRKRRRARRTAPPILASAARR